MDVSKLTEQRTQISNQHVQSENGSVLAAMSDLNPEGMASNSPRVVTIGLIQMRCSASPADNLAKSLNLVKTARQKGAQIVVLPELFTTPYFCQKNTPAFIAAAKRKYAVQIPGLITNSLAAAAKENQIVLVGGSLYEQTSDHYYNTSVVFGPDGRLIGQYRKSHIPNDPGFWEKHYFTKGDTGVRVFETPFGRLAVQICYDQWFSEWARIAALQGADILVYPTAIGDVDNLKDDGDGNWQGMWTAAQVGHAACNNIYVAAVNRVGTEGATTFFGGSFVADPMGRILIQAGVAEEVVIARCDLDFAENTRTGWRFFEERRSELYGEIIDR